MKMTLEEYAARFPGRRPPVPAEYAGQWLAWNNDESEIVAHGTNMTEVWNQAIQRGCANPVLQKIPRGPFIGAV
jgi:hypothetical protein